jgi:multidrug efflux pump subunit AcrB
VAVLLVLLFGAISFARLPIQLTPEVEEPEITITTPWRAAAPNEIEADIIEPQEDVLRGLPGMTELLANAQEGRGEITITFAVGTDLRRALVEVMNRLNQVPRYPEDADEPIISTVGADARAIAWFMIKPRPGNDRDISSYKDFVEEVVQTRFERVPGVARSEIYGGREREIRITFDPYKAASLGVQLPVVSQLAGTGKDISGGFADVGKRKYSVRFAGKYRVEELGELVIDWRNGKPVYLRDLAKVEQQLVDRNSFVITKGTLSIAVNAQREVGVNVLDVMRGLHQAAIELEAGPLARAGLTIEQVYDETVYIYRSIEMLRTNLGIGIILAVSILWWFLRRLRATLIVAATIPLCLLSAFIVLDASGRTLNVISLAGLAFAVGIVLDAAIVVLENIVRLRERGEPYDVASLNGTAQVWGALLASTATTVAIFLPLVFLADEAGQLFADLALTISVAVCASLVVAVTVIPTAASQWLRHQTLHDPHRHWWVAASGAIMRLTDTPFRRAMWIIVLLSVPVVGAYKLLPKADYLPEGNRNLVFAFILPPPGANIEQIEQEMGQVIATRMQPYVEGTEDPKIMHYFFVAIARGVFMGARTQDPAETDKLVPVLNAVVNGFPDTIAFAKRASLFGGFGEGRTIDMDLQGRNMESLLKAAQVAFVTIPQVIPGASVRPYPGLELAQPELRLVPNERRIAEAGWNRGIMANVVRALGDGLYVGDYFDGEQTIDIIVRAEQWKTPEELMSIPLATPNAGILPVSELVDVVRTAGPEEIRRINRRRTVTLRVTPPEDVALEAALEALRTRVEPVVEPFMPTDGDIRYTGTADKLQTALKSMSGSFLLAIAILYLLMSALFRSFLDSLKVLLSIPLATVGGVVALRLTNLVVFQPMDLLTMIGFIILLGLVVNNAILLVYQTRAAEREGLGRRAAVEQAVNLRLRPILMSTLTSIFGMLPLLLMPGAGTELYRGLAGVIVGGMSVSTVFTLILLPSLLRIGETRHPGTTVGSEQPASA